MIFIFHVTTNTVTSNGVGDSYIPLSILKPIEIQKVDTNFFFNEKYFKYVLLIYFNYLNLQYIQLVRSIFTTIILYLNNTRVELGILTNLT